MRLTIADRAGMPRSAMKIEYELSGERRKRSSAGF